MTDTSPIPQSPGPQAPGTKKLANHKWVVVVIIALVILGVAAVAYATYSSSRNDGDGAADHQARRITPSAEQKSANAVSNQQQAKAQPASDVGQETTVNLYATSTEKVNTVQTVVTYPSDSLQIVSITNSEAFPNAVATDSSAAGTIKLARAVDNQSASVSGTQVVATITFKKLQTVNAVTALVIDQSQSYLVSSSDNRNLIGTAAGSLNIR